MRTIASVLGLLILTACTVGIHDPDKFEQEATHVEKIYSRNFEDMFDCMSQTIQGDLVDSYVTKNSATMKFAGFMEIKLIPLSAHKTKMRASGLGYYAGQLPMYVETADKCAEAK